MNFTYWNNNQAYNHSIKLSNSGFSMIRFLSDSEFSGSESCTRNKQSGVFRCAAAVCPEQDVTQYMGYHLAWKGTMTTRYGMRWPLRAGVWKDDPELTFFGSLQGGRGINVEQALINALSERVSMTANQQRSDTHQLHPERLPWPLTQWPLLIPLCAKNGQLHRCFHSVTHCIHMNPYLNCC